MTSNKTKTPLSELASERLADSRYDAIYGAWTKALGRLDNDRDGAVTTARSLLETTCNFILDELSVARDEAWDLPKLYGVAAQTLGISPTQQTDSLFKAIFGASHTIVNRVGEMRNKLGDAHGKANLTFSTPRHHAELATNLACSICCFLISCLESTIASKRLISNEGKVILKFGTATIWRLVDHARNAPRSLPSYGRSVPKRALWLVGDSGVYLMSNGSPAMGENGKLITKKRVSV